MHLSYQYFPIYGKEEKERERCESRSVLSVSQADAIVTWRMLELGEHVFSHSWFEVMVGSELL